MNAKQRKQIERRLAVAKSAPDYDGKAEYMAFIKQELDLLPPLDKKEAGTPPPEAAPTIPPTKKVTSMLDTLPGGAKPSAAATSNKYTQDNPAKPTSKAEYDKLPPGSYYEQDGAVKRKKG